MVAHSFDLFDFFLLFSLARRRLSRADDPDVLVVSATISTRPALDIPTRMIRLSRVDYQRHAVPLR